MRNTAAYGDIFLVNTPTLDRLGQQLYQEQKIREQRQLQENAALDAGIQKELGKVRSVDTPDVIKSYGDYKQLRKQLLFDKDLQKDPLAYNKAQLAAQQAYQNIFTTANKSAEIKEMQKQLTTDRIKNPNAYADDFGARMGTLMQTPISALTAHPGYGDLTNWDNYRYQGSNTDFAKILKEAIGQPKQVYSDETPMDGGLQVKITPYNYANTPAQVKDYLIGSMALHQTGRDAAYQWDQLPEAEIENTIKQYQAIPKERWQRMGLQDSQDLLSKNPLNKAENFAAYQAMKYAIANEPKEGTPVFRQNLKAIKDLDWARQLKMQQIKQAGAENLVRLKKDIDPNDTDLNNSWVENYLDKIISEAKANPKGEHVIYRGKQYNGKVHEIPQDSVIEKAFTRGAGKNMRAPDKLYATEDGKVFPVFYKYDDNGNVLTNKSGHPLIDEDFGGPLSMDQAKLALGYRGQTKKQLDATMKGAKSPGPKIEDLRKKYNY